VWRQNLGPGRGRGGGSSAHALTRTWRPSGPARPPLRPPAQSIVLLRAAAAEHVKMRFESESPDANTYASD
jgi:hypothetical protein